MDKSKYADCPSGVVAGPMFPDKQIPLMITPEEGGDRSVSYITKWVKKHKKWLDEKLLDVGAVFFRGFDIQDCPDFEKVLLSYETVLSNEYRGTSPRVLQPGTNFVFSASELPHFFPIPQHCEMSFLPGPPKKLFFCCTVEPTSFGGETCLVDFRTVWEQMDPAIKSKFEKKGTMVIRNYNKKKSLFDPDVWKLKGWTDVWGTEDKQVINDECREQGLDIKWGDDESLRVVNLRPGVVEHPLTGKQVFFNHAPTFHIAMVPQEFRRIAWRAKSLFYLVLGFLFSIIIAFLRLCKSDLDFGMQVTYGDGEAISDKEMEHVRDVIWKNKVFPRWHKGDFVMIDNYAVSHGRQPYSGPRKVVVAWSEPFES